MFGWMRRKTRSVEDTEEWRLAETLCAAADRTCDNMLIAVQAEDIPRSFTALAIGGEAKFRRVVFPAALIMGSLSYRTVSKHAPSAVDDVRLNTALLAYLSRSGRVGVEERMNSLLAAHLRVTQQAPDVGLNALGAAVALALVEGESVSLSEEEQAEAGGLMTNALAATMTGWWT